MGKKVNPIAFRKCVSDIKLSSWHANSNQYNTWCIEDFQMRKWLENSLKSVNIISITIKRIFPELNYIQDKKDISKIQDYKNIDFTNNFFQLNADNNIVITIKVNQLSRLEKFKNINKNSLPKKYFTFEELVALGKEYAVKLENYLSKLYHTSFKNRIYILIVDKKPNFYYSSCLCDKIIYDLKKKLPYKKVLMNSIKFITDLFPNLKNKNSISGEIQQNVKMSLKTKMELYRKALREKENSLNSIEDNKNKNIHLKNKSKILKKENFNKQPYNYKSNKKYRPYNKKDTSIIKGIKIQLAGRLDGAEIARTETVSRGSIPLSTINKPIQYTQKAVLTKYGLVGVKVWLLIEDN